VMKGKKVNTLYILRDSTVTMSEDPDLDISRLWHMRLGHMSERGLHVLSKQDLLCGQKIGKFDFYEHCVFGKQHRVSFGTGVHKTKDTLDYIYSDVWGPSQVALKGEASYLLTLIDDYCRKVWVYPLKHKSNVFATFKQWKAMIEKQT